MSGPAGRAPGSDDEILIRLRAALDEVAPGRGDRLDAAAMDEPIGSLGLESVTLLELVGVLEERSGVLLHDDDLARVRSLRDLGTLLRGERLG
jgi:acyl carrier protein